MLAKEEQLKRKILSKLSAQHMKNKIKNLEKINNPIQILNLISNAVKESSDKMLKRGEIVTDEVQSQSFLDTLDTVLEILLRLELISSSLAETIQNIVKNNDIIKVITEGIEKGFDEGILNSETKNLDLISRDIGKLIAEITKFL